MKTKKQSTVVFAAAIILGVVYALLGADDAINKNDEADSVSIGVVAKQPLVINFGEGESLIVGKDPKGKADLLYQSKDLELSYTASEKSLIITVINPDNSRTKLVDVNKDYIPDTRVFSDKNINTIRVEKLKLDVIEARDIP